MYAVASLSVMIVYSHVDINGNITWFVTAASCTCHNEGTCVCPNVCQCAPSWTGSMCETRECIHVGHLAMAACWRYVFCVVLMVHVNSHI